MPRLNSEAIRVLIQVVSDGWCPKTRLVHGENFNYELLGFQHKCNACARKEEGSKAKEGESRCGIFTARYLVYIFVGQGTGWRSQ